MPYCTIEKHIRLSDNLAKLGPGNDIFPPAGVAAGSGAQFIRHMDTQLEAVRESAALMTAAKRADLFKDGI